MSSNTVTPNPIPNKTNTVLAILLANLSMLGPFSIDTYLPAFPVIQASLKVSEIDVQQSLTVYMVAFAFMILWHGAISDSVGRRRVILVSLVVYAMASVGCAMANMIDFLWTFRILQGLSAGAGMVVGRAIIRDLYSGPAAQRLLSLVMMLFATGPAIAPILGGYLVTLFDWRAIFLFLVLYSILLGWACYCYLPESLPPEKRQAFRMATLLRSYKMVFSSKSFHVQSGTVAFNFAGLFLYVAASPIFLTEHLGMTAEQFGWQFVPMVAGIFFGSLGANQLAGKITLFTQVRIGYVFLLGSALFNVTYHAFFPAAPAWSIAPLFFYAVGMSLVAPGVTLMTLDLFPHTRGIVASCQTCAVTFAGALMAGVAVPMLDSSPLWLALGQLGVVVGALACWKMAKKLHIPSSA